MKHIQKFQQLLKNKRWDAVLISRPLDIFYLTGVKVSEGALFLTSDQVILFVDNRYLEMCSAKLAIPCESKDTFDNAMSKIKISALYFDAIHTSVHKHSELKKTFRGTKIRLCPIDNPLEELRMQKEKSEISKLKKAAQIASNGFLHLLSLLHVGITEIELAKRFEIFCLENGADRLSFEPIIAFGKNTSMPHYRPQNVRLQKNTHILVDVGCVYESYCSDMTRVIFFGKPHHRIIALHNMVKKAQSLALDMCKQGQSSKSIDQEVRLFFRLYNVEEYFLHSLGHGIGLDIHESPYLKQNIQNETILQPSMAITIEPGLYIPDVGGIRIENSILITNKGYTDLTQLSQGPFVV